MSSFATFPEAKSVLRVVDGVAGDQLEPPVFIDCAAADAIYADGLDVVIEQGTKSWRFVGEDAELAKQRANELALRGSRGGTR